MTKTETPENGNREAWLWSAAEKLADIIAENGATVPAIRVSTGWAAGSRGGSASRAIGVAHPSSAATDGNPQIFISPELVDSSRVCDVLLHELVHATVGNAAGHGPAFRRLAVACGLTGKMTATIASPELNERLAVIVAELGGPYPHAKLSRTGARSKTYLIRVACESNGDCPALSDFGRPYVARITASWLEAYPAPLCPACGAPMLIGSQGSALWTHR